MIFQTAKIDEMAENSRIGDSARINGIDISNPEKKIFASYTKKDLVGYYAKIAEIMLPHIKNRLLSLYRFPNGTDKEGFFQKERPGFFPSWINHKKVPKHSDGGKGEVDYIVCDSQKSLVYVASQVAEFHISTSTTEKLGYPDKLMFDLDPESDNPAQIARLRKIARKLGELLSNIGLNPFIMTTGKKGYHIAVPIKPEQANEQVREFALKAAQVIENDNPDQATTELVKSKRMDRIFIDVNRNSPQQTSIAPYSVRAVKNATVALPISWDELESASPANFNIEKTIKRMHKRKDPWKDFAKKSGSLKEVVARLKK